MNKLVPELLVTNLDRSLEFYCTTLGFRVEYQRPESGFAFLDFNGAQLMLEEDDQESSPWRVEPLEVPFGRGMNLSIECPDIRTLAQALAHAGIMLRRDIQECWCSTRMATCCVSPRRWVSGRPSPGLGRRLQSGASRIGSQGWSVSRGGESSVMKGGLVPGNLWCLPPCRGMQRGCGKKLKANKVYAAPIVARGPKTDAHGAQGVSRLSGAVRPAWIRW